MKETKPRTVVFRLTEKQAQILSGLSQGTTKSEALRRLLMQAAAGHRPGGQQESKSAQT